MAKHIFFSIVFFQLAAFTSSTEAQTYIYNNDTSICIGQSVKLKAFYGGSGSFSVQGMDSIDDVYSVAVPIGFSFTFYGNTYTQCVLSANAYITFDISNASTPGSTPNYSPWPISAAIPSPTNPLNAIFGAWHDIDPGVPPYGFRGYATIGFAPNRKFIYAFCDVPLFSCNDSTYSGQIVLYEGSNDIEVHLIHKSNCTTWNGGAAILGVQDATGTVASCPPGFNFPTQWTATNTSFRFSWNATTSNYNYNLIPFSLVPITIGIEWKENGVAIGNGDSITVTPNVSSVYTVEEMATPNCSNGNSLKDTVTIQVFPSIIVGFSSSDTVLCTGNQVLFKDTSKPYPVDWKWTFSNGNNFIHQNGVNYTFSTAGLYTIKLTARDSLCGTDSIQRNITVYNSPTMNLPADVIYCPQNIPGIDITPTTNGTHYLWSTGDTTAMLHVNPSLPTYFSLVVNNGQCSSAPDTILITPKCDILVANVFSPNGDGKNERFRLLGGDVNSYTMKIFNRWGQEVYDYTGKDVATGWDGKIKSTPAETGVYVYILDVTLLNGEKKFMKGEVTLVR